MSEKTGHAEDHDPRYVRFRRGTVWPGRAVYGYKIVCSCGWEKRVNGSKGEAEDFFRDHLNEETTDE